MIKKTHIFCHFLFSILIVSFLSITQLSIPLTIAPIEKYAVPRNSSYIVEDFANSEDVYHLDLYKNTKNEGYNQYYYNIEGVFFHEFNHTYYLLATELEQKYSWSLSAVERNITRILIYKCNLSRQINETYTYDIIPSFITDQGFTVELIDFIQIGENFYIAYTIDIYNSISIYKRESGILVIDINNGAILSNFITGFPLNNEFKFTQINFETNSNGDIKAYGIGDLYVSGQKKYMIFYIDIYDFTQGGEFFPKFEWNEISLPLNPKLNQIKRYDSNSFIISIILKDYNHYRIIKYYKQNSSIEILYNYIFSDSQVYNIDFFDLDLNVYLVYTNQEKYNILKISATFDKNWEFNSFSRENSYYKINWMDITPDGNILVAGDYIINTALMDSEDEDFDIFRFNHIFLDIINPFGHFIGTLRFCQRSHQNFESGLEKPVQLSVKSVYVCNSGEILFTGHTDFPPSRGFSYAPPNVEEIAAFGLYFSIKSLLELSEGTIFKYLYLFNGGFALGLIAIGIGIFYWKKKYPT